MAEDIGIVQTILPWDAITCNGTPISLNIPAGSVGFLVAFGSQEAARSWATANGYPASIMSVVRVEEQSND